MQVLFLVVLLFLFYYDSHNLMRLESGLSVLFLDLNIKGVLVISPLDNF